MSGPPYPPAPLPGSNAIGLFAIGISPIGTIPPFNFWTTVISQYANSPIIISLIESFYDAVDQTENFDNFYDLLWNVLTAQGYGLDVWGRIVGVTRVVQLAAGAYLGFEGPTGTSGDPFDVSPFFSGGTLTNNFTLTDDAYRLLILAKALANITDDGIQSINQLLLNLFPNRGNCYVVDNLDMTMAYTFEFALTGVEFAILSQSGILPTPVGVLSSISVIAP